MREHLCKDCRADPPATVRKLKLDKKTGIPVPGPRCDTHHRLFLKQSRQKRKAGHALRQFKITDVQYDRLYEQQGGRCAAPGCPATGASKRLAIDHDHSCCPGETSCGNCVRGLLCGPHNQEVGRNHDRAEYYEGMADYLRNPPAHWVLARRRNADGQWDWAYAIGARPARGQEKTEIAAIAAENRRVPNQRSASSIHESNEQPA